jgi:hypothetical protein
MEFQCQAHAGIVAVTSLNRTTFFVTTSVPLARGPPCSRTHLSLAATAIVHRLKVATRNVRDFEALGVELINPFESDRTP